jgi:predicted transglutaminase-like cysteine proteinase
MKKLALYMIIIIIISIFAGCINLYNNNSKQTKSDIDNDGVPDHVDAFPSDPAASIDTDGDGFPDEWNKGQNQDNSTLNLIIDAFRYDPSASIDKDNDGYPDKWNDGKDQGDSTTNPPLELDEFPNDPNAHVDTDKDGYADYYDIYDYGDLSIDIKIRDFKIINKVDFLGWAQVYFKIIIEGSEEEITNDGKKWWVLLNQKQSVNKVIHYDIPDNKITTKITIEMYDSDLFKVDIISISDKENLSFVLDNVKASDVFNIESRGSQGVIWYDITYVKEEKPVIETFTRNYAWRFDRKYWRISLEVPVDTYNYYIEYETNRNPQNDPISPNTKMVSFVTSNEEVIENIAEELSSIAHDQGYDEYTTANFILQFVQENIDYELDNETKGCTEYWRYPVETLVEKKGDCEDSSVLYAAIMNNLGYDVVILFYTWIENDETVGHLAIGIKLEGDHGSFIEDKNSEKYYYCETTTKAFNVGEIPENPEELLDGPSKIIHV